MSMYQMPAQKILLCASFLSHWQVTGCRAYLEAAKDAEGEDGFRPLQSERCYSNSWMVFDETAIEMDDLEVPALYVLHGVTHCYTPKQCVCLFEIDGYSIS